MPTHSQRRHVLHPPAEMYELVADIARYPDFLPWCIGARVRKREAGTEPNTELVTADLIIAYKMFREKFTSRVTLDHDRLAIDVAYLEGPFRHLANHWRFLPREEGGGSCDVDFHIDFEFKSKTLQLMTERVFARATNKLVTAFVDRADQLNAPASVTAVVEPE